MQDIYSVYVPVDVQALKADVFAQVMKEFIAACQAVYAASPDEVEKPCPDYANPHLYDVVRKYIEDFEAVTKLTLHQDKLMTVSRRDLIVAKSSQETPT